MHIANITRKIVNYIEHYTYIAVTVMSIKSILQKVMVWINWFWRCRIGGWQSVHAYFFYVKNLGCRIYIQHTIFLNRYRTLFNIFRLMKTIYIYNTLFIFTYRHLSLSNLKRVLLVNNRNLCESLEQCKKKNICWMMSEFLTGYPFFN